jgi:putative spermidine/putrescine transport system permease protein
VATWVRLRLPHLRRLIEFICLLPLTIPAVVLVVGIAPIYAWVTYLLGDSPLTLTFVYVVLVLPYAYRAIDNGLGAIDLRTLAEAARSLGARWPTVLARVVVPNIRGALVSASFLTVTLVLGEFTLASLLNFNNLQVTINLLGKRNAALAVAVSLAALLLAFVLLLLLSYVGRRQGSSGVTEEG